LVTKLQFKNRIAQQYNINKAFAWLIEDNLEVAGNVDGLLIWGIVAVSTPAENLIKETNFYLKSKAKE